MKFISSQQKNKTVTDPANIIVIDKDQLDQTWLNILLTTFRDHPEQIKAKIFDRERNIESLFQLEADTQKLEKFEHTKYEIAYLIEMARPEISEITTYELRLKDPIKKQPKLPSEPNKDSFVVMDERLGNYSKGSY